METIARKADVMEQCIEGHFRRYLRERVESCDGDLVLRYVPAGLADADAEEEVMNSPSTQLSSGYKAVEIRVLTPLFYSRLVQYRSVAEALTSENTLSATVALSSDLLTIFPFLTSAELKSSRPDFDSRTSILDILRLRPDPILIPVKERVDVTVIPWSEQSDEKDEGTSLDAFVLSTGSAEEKKVYFQGVFKLMLANRIAFGWMEILGLEIFTIRAVVAWGLVRMFL